MNSEKTQRIFKTIMIMVLTILITVLVTTVVLYRHMKDDGETKYILVNNEDTSIGGDIAKYRAIVDQYYLGEIDEQELRDGAIKGYIEGLGDEYSQYITKDEYADFEANIMGNYVGIGIYMAVYKDSEEIVVVSPMPNSPAEKAGLKSGDIITKVDGIAYTGDELDTASNKIKGKEGTTVSLEIKREEETFTVDIVRQKVVINPVTSEVLEGDIGYISLVSFDEDCSVEFKTKYEELVRKGIKSLIIDLRNNGGGLVKEALDIADFIVPKGKDLLITVNKTENETVSKADEDPIITVPVVVLVNENSASASEILAGALKDNGVAKIIGTKTYGKGVIQEILRLTDGSALKLTTEEYYTPNKTKINKIGIEPDIVVELPEDVAASYDIEREKDTQLQRAIEELK